jgi:hypothetical protein
LNLQNVFARKTMKTFIVKENTFSVWLWDRDVFVMQAENRQCDLYKIDWISNSVVLINGIVIPKLPGTGMEAVELVDGVCSFPYGVCAKTADGLQTGCSLRISQTNLLANLEFKLEIQSTRYGESQPS